MNRGSPESHPLWNLLDQLVGTETRTKRVFKGIYLKSVLLGHIYLLCCFGVRNLSFLETFCSVFLGAEAIWRARHLEMALAFPSSPGGLHGGVVPGRGCSRGGRRRAAALGGTGGAAACAGDRNPRPLEGWVGGQWFGGLVG